MDINKYRVDVSFIIFDLVIFVQNANYASFRYKVQEIGN